MDENKKTPKGTPQDIAEKMLKNIGESYKLDDVDRAIIAIINRYPSITHEEIGKAIGYSRSRITIRMNRPAFKAAIYELRKGVTELLVEVQIEALKEIRRLLKSDNEEIRLGAARLALAPLNRVEQNTSLQQNIVYAVQVGEGGQIYRTARPMTQDDGFVERVKQVTDGN